MSDICFHHGQKSLARRRMQQVTINGYEYMCSKRFRNGMYVICKYKKIKNCKFRGKIVNDQLIIFRNHNHASIRNAELIFNFERSLYEEVKNQHFKSLRIIYDEVSLLDHEAAVHVSWAHIYPKMLRWRRQTRPPIPSTIEQYINIIEMPEWNAYTSHNQTNITVTTIEDEDDSKTIIYADFGFLRSLNHVSDFFIDATFKVIPKKPMFRQFLTILGLVQDSVIPLCWALMQKKDTSAYENILTYFFINLAPHLRPLTINTDFESALATAIRRVYPEATHIRCYFHFCQAIMKRIKKLHLLNAFNDSHESRLFIQKLLVLPLLPGEDIELAFYWILSTTIPALLLQFKKLLKYFRNQWINRIRPNLYSVFLQIFRTNNFSEAYNKVLHLRFGTHPNIWDFTEKLVIMQELKRIEYESLQNGNPTTRQSGNNEASRNEIIHRAWFLYQNNQFGIPQFINCVSHLMNELKNGRAVDIQQIDDFIVGDPIGIEFVVGQHITACTICEGSVTNYICRPCNHWFGCSRCVQHIQALLVQRRADLLCPLCADVVTSFEMIF